jgi:hypothetical protein
MTTRALMFLAAPLALISLAAARKPIDPAWRTDYAAACKEAERAGKPLMVVFR